MLKNMYSRVLWQNTLSDKFTIDVGTRQGAFCSPDEYLTYQYEQLIQLDSSKCGMYIGSIHLPAPTVADDTLIMANNITDLQTLLNIAGDYANKERYEIQLEKTSVVNINTSEFLNNLFQDVRPWTLNEGQVNVSNSFTHLGIDRNAVSGSIDPSIDTRLANGRKTTYALMGAGCVGCYGNPPKVNFHIYNIFILPRITYGLEALKLLRKHLTALETQHRAFIRNILYLPKRTAIAALHILSGQLPLQATIEMKILSFLFNCLANPGLLRDIIIRQHAMKDANSHSWVIYIEEVLRRYDLPTIASLILEPVSKGVWKAVIKDKVFSYWRDLLQDQALEKSTLHHLNPIMQHNKTHLSLDIALNPTMVKRANIKCRILTSTYSLQYNRYHYYKQVSRPTCLLCDTGEEDKEHFVLKCTDLQSTRSKFLPSLCENIPYVYSGRPTIIYNSDYLLQLVLDCSHQLIMDIIPLSYQEQCNIEAASQVLLYSLHNARHSALLRKANLTN